MMGCVDGCADKSDPKKTQAKQEIGKIVPIEKTDRAVVIPISMEEQLFVNLGMQVKAKAEAKDADDELADLI